MPPHSAPKFGRFLILGLSEALFIKSSWLAAALSTWESPDPSTNIATCFFKPTTEMPLLVYNSLYQLLQLLIPILI